MLPLMGNIRGFEWIIILGLAVLLFGGAKKLPDAARGLGRSLRIFKAETKGLIDDDASPQHSDPAQAAPAPPATTVLPTETAKVAAPPVGPTGSDSTDRPSVS